jgi:hypothetical protein
MTSARVTFVQRYTPVLKAPGGERYVARAYMDRQADGLWEAWLVFLPLTKGAALATGRETTQGKREHVLYWASGLGRTYLQGALERALDLRPAARRASRGARRNRREMHALAEAEVYAAEAARALRSAEVARRRAGPGARITP